MCTSTNPNYVCNVVLGSGFGLALVMCALGFALHGILAIFLLLLVCRCRGMSSLDSGVRVKVPLLAILFYLLFDLHYSWPLSTSVTRPLLSGLDARSL